MERKDLLLANAQIFSAQGKALDAVANRNVRVLVVGNPANTNALIAQRNAPGLNQRNFTAMVRLDHNRALSQLAEKTGTHITQDPQGRRSGAITPRLSIPTCITRWSTASRRCRWSIRSGTRRLSFRSCSSAARPSSRRAAQSSAASAASAAIDHVRDWVKGTPDGDWVSMGVPSDGSYGIPAGVIYGYPVTCKNGDYQIVQGLAINEFSRQRMDATHKELLEERDGVKELI